MTATPRLDMAVLDVPDVERLATFYRTLTGWEMLEVDPTWAVLQVPDGRKVSFQQAPDLVPPQWPGQDHPQQLHLDLQVADPGAAAERAVDLGATRLGEGSSWITLADPAGHPFVLCLKEGVGEVMDLFAVTIDAPDASALAGFYSDLLALPVTYDGPEGAMVAGDVQTLLLQQVEGYRAPRWPDPAYPQQGHLDLEVDDLDAGEARALEVGATRLPGQGEGFRVFADPAGHPFCLCLP